MDGLARRGRWQRTYDTSRYERCRGFRPDAAGWPLALAIREARRAARLTQEGLAAKLGVSRAMVAQWETARRGVPMRRVPDLVEALPEAAAWKIERQWSPHHGEVARLAST